MSALATSIAARVAIRPVAKNLRQRVFLAIYAQGTTGATLEEVETLLGVAGNTVRPRRIELEARGLVTDSGKTRKTKSGREAVVWIVPAHIAAKTEALLKSKGLE